MVISVCNLKCGQRYAGRLMSPVSDFFRVVQPVFLKIGICPDFTHFWQMMSHFRFWLAGQGKVGGCIICILQLGKNQVARSLSVNSANCYISVKLKFWVVSVQRDPAKNYDFCTSQSSEFWKSLSSCLQLTWTGLLLCSWLQAWPNLPSFKSRRKNELIVSWKQLISKNLITLS
jgi:hypothetical protein